jgi:hypothetical protein
LELLEEGFEAATLAMEVTLASMGKEKWEPVGSPEFHICQIISVLLSGFCHLRYASLYTLLLWGMHIKLASQDKNY